MSSMWLICQHEKRHICLDMSNRRVSTGGDPDQPVFWSGSSPDGTLRSILTVNIGLVWLASRGVDDAYFGNVGSNSSKMLRDEAASSHTY